jgi:nucleoside-triphosphatase
MKILLTAPPKTGKTTVIEKFVSLYPGKKIGIIAKEIRNEGERVGFKNVNLAGVESAFMHVSEIQSDVTVGNKYKIDVAAIDNFVVPEITKDAPGSVVIIDEIGRAQANSQLFLSAVEQLLSGTKQILATIVYDPEPWSLGFKENPEVLLIEVTTVNREALPAILMEAFLNAGAYEKLSSSQKIFVKEEFSSILNNGEFVRAKKLFKNAVPYVVGGKVKFIQSFNELDEYFVEGNTDIHKTVFHKTENHYSCDCDLFNGKGQFFGQPSACSHIDAVRITHA